MVRHLCSSLQPVYSSVNTAPVPTGFIRSCFASFIPLFAYLLNAPSPCPIHRHTQWMINLKRTGMCPSCFPLYPA